MDIELDLSDEALACFNIESDFVPKPSVTCPTCWEIVQECECGFTAASLKARFLALGVRSVYVVDMYDILESEGVDREEYIVALDELRRGFVGKDIAVRFDGRRYITLVDES